jgi:arylsulfatase A-like enzyme
VKVRPSAVISPTMSSRMASAGPREDRSVDRRTLLRRGLMAGGALLGAALGIRAAAEAGEQPPPTPAPEPRQRPRAAATASANARRPNILVIVVDQLRYPQWLGATPLGLAFAPNLMRLRNGGVSFARHYTASNDCTPSRSTLLTGLYTHQTGCMITGGSTLEPGFPTWGTMLREHGYHTRWLGKWHLTHRDNHWVAARGERALERYGFAGGVYPSPDGAPGQGWRVDPLIAERFTEWLAHEGGSEPWCTTVSFVNPHDIAWWYRWSDRVPPEAFAARVASSLPPNYETPELLRERRKPRLQHSLQDTAAASFGPVPFTLPDAEGTWLSFLDLYTKLQREVDRHVGHVLRALARRPAIAANTVIVFTSDHGEYGGSHGLRGKGASAYEEATRIPLIVKDPRGILTSSPELTRNQLTSSVDVAPLLLTIATGSEGWRSEPHYAHLARRPSLAAILADPQAPGRDFVLHATDEQVTEFALESFAADAPLHVVALRTANAKYATYTHWRDGHVTPIAQGEEVELYDYSTHNGRLELNNSAGASALEAPMRAQLEDAVRHELRGPLPSHLRRAQARGFADYGSTARASATAAATRRRLTAERAAASFDLRNPLRSHDGFGAGAPARR